MAISKRQYRAFLKRQREQREQHRRGSHGAASSVRQIDPANYQPQQPHRTERPPAQNKTTALRNAADRLLIADAKRRRGKRFGKRVKDQIAAGRYGAR